MPPHGDAEFGTEDALAAQVSRINAEAEVPDTAPPPPPEPEPATTKGGFFGKLMGKRGEPAAPPSDMASSSDEDARFGAPTDAAFGAAPVGSLPTSQDASFDAGFPDEGAHDPSLADPDLVAAAFGETVSKQKKARKGLPVVAIGWGILALIVLIVVGLFALAPATTVSILPGASRIYAMLGMPVGVEGLAFDGVRYGWTSAGGQTVLEVQGNVRNTSSATMAVPTVVIALRDENGDEISEWTTEVGAAELAAGEEAPFLRQIPSPPSNVRSLKVRFADADK